MIQAKSIIRIGKKIDSLSFSQVENKKIEKVAKGKINTRAKCAS